MDGFININKGQGLTSFAVVKKLQKIIPRTKMGHLGTLDPMAEGVLPVALGNATRLIEYIPDGEKVYRATMTLGGISDTQDAWGTIEPTANSSYRSEDLLAILGEFTGIIQQIPPMYSAVHHHGTRLYELARQGIEVERQARQIEIISLQLLATGMDHAGQPTIDMEIACSKGTYIRTLCHDIGQRLGTGAYMSKLIRTKAGIFAIQEAFSLEELAYTTQSLAEIVKPLDYPIMNLPLLSMDKQEDLTRIYNGNQINIETELAEGLIRLSHQGELIAIAKIISTADHKYIQPVKVFRVTGDGSLSSRQGVSPCK